MIWLRFQLFLLTLLLVTATQAQARPAIPQPKPGPVNISDVMSREDSKQLRAVHQALQQNKTDQAWTRARKISDPDIKNLAIWMIAENKPTFFSVGERIAFAQKTRGWPVEKSARAATEDKLLGTDSDQDRIRRFFANQSPVSGDGEIALASTFIRSEPERAKKILRSQWRNACLSEETRDWVLQNYAGWLTRQDHEARVDMLFWHRRHSEARRLYPKISISHRHLAEARIQIRGRHRGANKALGKVASAKRQDPGLLYARAYYKRRNKDYQDALALLVQAEPPETAIGRIQLWKEKKIHLRLALKNGDAANAYKLAENHGMSSGAAFADASFLAGWISLRKLGNGDAALEHFRRLEQGVSTPVSMARAQYWQGRALEAMGKSADAAAAYRAAARHGPVFYAILAREKAGIGHFSLADYAADSNSVATDAARLQNGVLTPSHRQNFYEKGPTKALIALGELGDTRLFRKFAYAYDDQLNGEEKLVWFSEIMHHHLQPSVSLRAGKTLLRRGKILPDILYPMPFEAKPGRYVQPATVFAIARQESEFDPTAISSARAYGLMQMINGTASLTARKRGWSYERLWLLTDEEYSVRLGTARLDDLHERFAGSLPMMAAAYNAGAHRVDQWMDDYGDPRSRHTDGLDWLESIPFSETNNYVQRVLENHIIYSARLNDGTTTLSLTRIIDPN